MKKISAKIKVRGIVQGVGFRYYTVREARRIGVFGYVKNEYDGSVFAYAEGDEEDVDSFVESLKRGPSSAVVESVEVEKDDYTGSYNDFRIEY
ncbi:MAG: acylphosphatase [Candidatus Schekmanbacteria bacterium]|nr:MAG: acylphosphatase [Candidatus Schekmanbacteria bacterium]